MERFKVLEHPVSVDFTPKDVKFVKYVLQDSLGKAEAEEMAARFLEFWAENDEWKAVAFPVVCQRLDEQFNNLQETLGKVTTLMILDACRSCGGSSFAEIGVRYLLNEKYIVTQRVAEGDDVIIYIAPTDKLLNAIRAFVVK